MKLALELSKNETVEGNELEGNEEEDTADDDLLGIKENSVDVCTYCYTCMYMCTCTCIMYLIVSCVHMCGCVHVQSVKRTKCSIPGIIKCPTKHCLSVINMLRHVYSLGSCMKFSRT